MSTRLYNVMNKLVSRLENFDDTIKNWMNTNHKWRYVGQATGSAIVNLPSDDDWNEVYVRAFFGNNPTWTIAFFAIRPELPIGSNESGAGYIGGQGAGDTHSANVVITRTIAQLGAWNYRTSNVTASSYIRVYVR